jgi:galactosamine-6-phosphate isomerase
MNLTLFRDYAALSAAAADEIIRLLQVKPGAVICMASGSTPKDCCTFFVQKVKEGGTDISKFFFVGLDEWVGLPPGLPGSCQYDFKTRLFDPLNLPPSQYHVFDGRADNLPEECRKMDQKINEKGGIDLMIVGIGMNGHIGFNEPGVDFSLFSHVTDLDETTITVGQNKYFTEPVVLTKGITLGPGTLMAAKKVILMANGIAKAEVIQKAMEGPVTNSFPASIIQQHPDGNVWVDEAAASNVVK